MLNVQFFNYFLHKLSLLAIDNCCALPFALILHSNYLLFLNFCLVLSQIVRIQCFLRTLVFVNKSLAFTSFCVLLTECQDIEKRKGSCHRKGSSPSKEAYANKATWQLRIKRRRPCHLKNSPSDYSSPSEQIPMGGRNCNSFLDFEELAQRVVLGQRAVP